jgi:hypothetical protein
MVFDAVPMRTIGDPKIFECELAFAAMKRTVASETE